MKLRRILSSFLAVLVLVLGTSFTAFAEDNLVLKLREVLEDAGVPAEQTGKVVEYLQKVKVTQAQADAVIEKVNEAKAQTGGETDLTKLSDAVRDDIKSTMVEAAQALGLTADFSKKDSKGATVVTLLDKDGKALVTASTTTVMEEIKNFDIDDVKEAVEQAQGFSNNPDKTEFHPVTGAPMTKTGTNYGNVMALGVLMVAAAAGTLLFARKRAAA